MEKILIAIPAYGGNIKALCFQSVLNVIKEVKDYEINVLTVQNDALIQRARQEIVKETLNREVDKLFFVDADIVFTSEQFLKIVEADKDVVGGTYMKKGLKQPSYNFNLSKEITIDLLKNYQTPPNSLKGLNIVKEKYCKENPILKAVHVPTGFLCIKTDILKKLYETIPTYLSDRRGNHKVAFSEEEMKKMQVAELFPVSIQNNILESEDYGFCRLCKENDIDVFLHTDVVVDHIGSIVFHPGLFGN